MTEKVGFQKLTDAYMQKKFVVFCRFPFVETCHKVWYYVASGVRNMQRVLVASKEEGIGQGLSRRLSDKYQIETCGTGEWAAELLRVFKPDVMVVDTNLVDLDAFSLIRAVRASGNPVGIILLTPLDNACVNANVSALQIEGVLCKPFKMAALASYVHSVALWMRDPKRIDMQPEYLVDTLLMDLGFCIGIDRHYTVKQAILAKFFGPTGMLMKQVYLDVAKTCNGNDRQVEKAVRDAVRSTWRKGNSRLWDLYFCCYKNGERSSPTNDEFISRMAEALRSCQRLKEPYTPKEKIIG